MYRSRRELSAPVLVSNHRHNTHTVLTSHIASYRIPNRLYVETQWKLLWLSMQILDVLSYKKPCFLMHLLQLLEVIQTTSTQFELSLNVNLKMKNTLSQINWSAETQSTILPFPVAIWYLFGNGERL